MHRTFCRTRRPAEAYHELSVIYSLSGNDGHVSSPNIRAALMKNAIPCQAKSVRESGHANAP